MWRASEMEERLWSALSSPLAIATGLAIGTVAPASAVGLTQATLTCDDGTTTTVIVDTNNFFPVIEVTPSNSTRFSFNDNGNPGHQPPGVDDTLNGIYTFDDSTCSTGLNTPPPSVDLVHGNITVHD